MTTPSTKALLVFCAVLAVHCGQPPANTKADGGDAALAPPLCAVQGAPGVDSVTLGCSVTGVDAIEVSYWGEGDRVEYDPHKRTFTAPPYVLDGLLASVDGRKYLAFAVAIKGTARSTQSNWIEFTTAKMPDACAGFVVPLATRCSSDGLPPYGDPEVWTLKPGPEHCYLQGSDIDFIMTPEISGATRFTATSTAIRQYTCVQ